MGKWGSGGTQKIKAKNWCWPYLCSLAWWYNDCNWIENKILWAELFFDALALHLWEVHFSPFIKDYPGSTLSWKPFHSPSAFPQTDFEATSNFYLGCWLYLFIEAFFSGALGLGLRFLWHFEFSYIWQFLVSYNDTFLEQFKMEKKFSKAVSLRPLSYLRWLGN